LWMGAHPGAPSRVLVDGRWISLQELIQKAPLDILGKETAEKFSNEIPFLFKVLAAAEPLSIQAHPDKAQALEGFKRETELNIPLDAANRSYKDKNHKPEIFCALTPCWALKGFRRVEEIAATLDKLGIREIVDFGTSLGEKTSSRVLKRFFAKVITLEKEGRERIVKEATSAALEGAAAAARKDPEADIDPVMSWILKLHQAYPGDVGCLSPLFLNLVCLNPGEALLIPPGELHAYLDGAGIELMANSDNVLRGGLTPKTIDRPELLKILKFHEGPVNILKPESRGSGELLYPAEVEEFTLSRITVHEGAYFESPRNRSMEIMICMEGDGRITDLNTDDALPFSRGVSFIVPAAVDRYRVEGNATLYKAAVPLT
ncbi:MAG: mannose-6-phosphate isomerase, class I, partial [Pseudomonadota bacterium]